MELFLFTMHQLALSSDFLSDTSRPPTRAFLLNWLRHRRTETSAALTHDSPFTSVERQQLLAGLATYYDLPLAGTETEKLRTVADVEQYLHGQLAQAAA
ncbi:hypothetical protein [Hymenobacter daeguensis]